MWCLLFAVCCLLCVFADASIEDLNVFAESALADINIKCNNILAVSIDSLSVPLGSLLIDAVQFNYAALAESYTRDRTVYLIDYPSNRIAYVEADNSRTVFIQESPSNRVVYAQAA